MSLCPLLLSALISDIIKLRPEQNLCMSLSVYWFFLCLGLVSLEVFIPSGSYNLSASSSTGFPVPWREGIDEYILVRTQHSKVSQVFVVCFS